MNLGNAGEVLPFKKGEVLVMIEKPFVRELIKSPSHRIHEKYKLKAKARAGKPTDMSRMAEVHQRPEESPIEFCERLCKAYWVYIPFDPEARENPYMVNAAFVAQSSTATNFDKMR